MGRVNRRYGSLPDVAVCRFRRYLESGEIRVFTSAHEIDNAMASSKLQSDISGEVFWQMGQYDIFLIPSFEVSIGINGKVEVKGIEDAAVKEKVEDTLNGFSGELMDTYS